MKFHSHSSQKSYINLINYCDIALADEYLVIMPFQTFPSKMYHHPVLIAKNEIVPLFVPKGFECIKPEKVLFKEVLKGEIEIIYHKRYQRRHIRMQGLNADQKNQFERIRNWN